MAATSISSASANVHVASTEAQGRYLLAARPIAAGEVLLAEAPAAWWLDARRRGDTCARCLGDKATTACVDCGGCAWCSDVCRQEDAARHAFCCPFMRASEASLQQIGQGSDGTRTGEVGAAAEEAYEEATLLACVAHTAELRAIAPSAFADVWAMHADLARLTAEEEGRCARVHATCTAVSNGGSPVDLDFVRGACARDKANGFALTSVAGDDAREHREGAYAFYPALALANHSCLPTAARFDDLEAPPPGAASSSSAARFPIDATVGLLRTAALESPALLARPPCSLATRYVALQALDAGSEIAISYTPLDVTVAPRSDRLTEEYGFGCGCARCLVERQAEAHHGADGADHSHSHSVADHEPGVDVTYVNLFVLKYCCARCSGTLAPLASSAQVGGGEGVA